MFGLISEEDAVLLAVYKLSGGNAMVEVDEEDIYKEVDKILAMNIFELEEYKNKLRGLTSN